MRGDGNNSPRAVAQIAQTGEPYDATKETGFS
jgi:hypothetical protein